MMVFEGAWTTKDIRKSLLQLPLQKTRATFTGSSQNDLEIDETAMQPRHGNRREKIRLVCCESCSFDSCDLTRKAKDENVQGWLRAWSSDLIHVRRSMQEFSRRLSAIDIWQKLPEKVVEAPVLDLRQGIANVVSCPPSNMIFAYTCE